MTAGLDSSALATRDDGKPQDPALLLLHGFTGSGAVWAGLAATLRRKGFRTVAPDLPGHGRTGIPAGSASGWATVEDTADQLAELLDRLGVSPASVLGYSLGARVALRLAIAHPAAVARLVLESPSAGVANVAERAARRQADDALADEIERDGVEAFIDRWERNQVFASHATLDPRTAAHQRGIRLRNSASGLALSLRAAGQGAMQPLHDRLAEVRVPTLVVAGALDPARARAEAVAAGIPGARLAIVPGAGHTPHLERAPAFRRLVIDFLQEDAA